MGSAADPLRHSTGVTGPPVNWAQVQRWPRLRPGQGSPLGRPGWGPESGHGAEDEPNALLKTVIDALRQVEPPQI